MKARTLFLGLVVLLCALPVLAQDIPAGDDVWDSVGGGSTDTTLSSADWRALCGVTVPDTTVLLKGYNLPGYGTGDTVVTRLDSTAFGTSNPSTVRIQLKALSFVNDGSHPCSPLTIRVRQDATQAIGTMSITRTGSAGGTFTAQVPVNAIIEAVNSSGVVVGSTYVSGVLGDNGGSPWAYGSGSGLTTGAVATRTGTLATTSSWKPGVDPVTQQPVRVCRYGNKIMPAHHCYQPPPPCPVKNPTPAATTDASSLVAAEPCFLTDTTSTTPKQP